MRKKGQRGVQREYRDLWIEVQRLARRDRTLPASAIQEKVEERAPDRTWPDERTVRAWVTAARKDDSQPWTLADAVDVDEARAVLAVLPAVVEDTQGRSRHVTVDEADMIARAYAVAPDMPPLELVIFALEYLALKDEPGLGTPESLDLYLAFTPWRDNGERYLRAIREDRVPVVHWFSKEMYELIKQARLDKPIPAGLKRPEDRL